MTDFMTQNQEQCFFHPTQTDAQHMEQNPIDKA